MPDTIPPSWTPKKMFTPEEIDSARKAVGLDADGNTGGLDSLARIYAGMYGQVYVAAAHTAGEYALDEDAVAIAAERAATYIAGRTMARILDW